MTGFASDGVMPSVPSPTFGMWKAADANDVKLIMFLIDDRMRSPLTRLTAANKYAIVVRERRHNMPSKRIIYLDERPTATEFPGGWREGAESGETHRHT